jgi:hypothetical protein
MRLFKNVVQDHATYDALLVKQFEHESNWTRSSLPGEVPVTLAHFVEDTRQRLGAHLSTMPELAGQDFGDRRKLLQHLAHKLTLTSGRFLHTWQMHPDEMSLRIRTDLRLIAREGQIVINADEHHPLEGDYKARPASVDVQLADGSMGKKWVSALKVDTKDQAVAKHLLGPQPNLDSDLHTQQLLISALPELFYINGEKLRTPLLDLRLRMREKLKHCAVYDDKERNELLKMLQDELQQWLIDNPDLIDAANEQIPAGKDGAMVDAMECPPDVILDHLIAPLLDKDKIEYADRQLLMKRMPALEFIASQTVDDKNSGNQKRLMHIFEQYCKKLQAHMHELRYFGIAMATQATDVDPDKFQEMLT